MTLVASGFVLVVASASLGARLGPSQPCPATGFSCERTSVVDPGTWYPLCVGTRWTYRNTNAMATGNNGVVETRWISSEEVVSRTPCTGGLVVRIDVTPSNIERDYPAGLAADSRTWFEKNVAVPSSKGYLVRGSAMYPFTPTSWGEPCRSVNPERLREIDGSQAEFYFPLEDGAMWSDREREEQDYAAICAAYRGEGQFPNPGFYYWRVEDREDIDVPWHNALAAWHMAYFAVGGAPHRWFVRHVGIVKERFSHNGSLWETSSALLSFRTGPRCGGGE